MGRHRAIQVLLAFSLLYVSIGVAGCGLWDRHNSHTGHATITVDDGADPIEGASVTLNGHTDATNAQGQVTFSNVPIGDYTVTAAKTGYASGSVDITIADGETATATVTLSRQFGGATITVNDGTDTIEGASVTLNGQTNATNAEGQVTFSNVPVGDYTVTAAKTGYANGSAAITIADGETATATVTLTRQFGNATITVNDGTNTIEGASVTLNGQTNATNAEGQATFNNVPVGDYTVTAAKTGYTSNSVDISITDGATATATVSLTRQTGNATITVDDGADPISGASVTLNGQTLTTNALGRVTFSNVPTGPYTVSATAANYDGNTADITVAYGETATAAISLSRQTGDVSVWVFDHSNFATMGNVSMSGVGVTMYGRTVVTNSYGCADFTNVPTGTYTATASYTGFVTNSISVTVTHGRTLDTGYVPGTSYRILLDKPVADQITITALCNDDSPLVGATVKITNQSSGSSMSGTTNASGQVTFNNVANGNWTVLVTPADYLYPNSSTITVTDTNNTFVIKSQWW